MTEQEQISLEGKKLIAVGLFINGKPIAEPMSCFAEEEDEEDGLIELFKFIIDGLWNEGKKGRILATGVRKMVEVGQIYDHGTEISLDTKIGDLVYDDMDVDGTKIPVAKIAVNSKADDGIFGGDDEPEYEFCYCEYCGASISSHEMVCPHCDCEVK